MITINRKLKALGQIKAKVSGKKANDNMFDNINNDNILQKLQSFPRLSFLKSFKPWLSIVTDQSLANLS